VAMRVPRALRQSQRGTAWLVGEGFWRQMHKRTISADRS
jgi:hypothetical protein